VACQQQQRLAQLLLRQLQLQRGDLAAAAALARMRMQCG
jgi:hypothetical protein